MASPAPRTQHAARRTTTDAMHVNALTTLSNKQSRCERATAPAPAHPIRHRRWLTGVTITEYYPQLGSTGWVNAAGHPTVPVCLGKWSDGFPVWLIGGWRNRRGQVTFPLASGGWMNGRGGARAHTEVSRSRRDHRTRSATTTASRSTRG
jgi:hypothetical protein